jgi:hypothetical protein
MTIELIALDKDGYDVTRWECDTIKEAKQLAKQWRTAEHWAIWSESDEFAATIENIQILKNGECIADWYPEFSNC